MTREELLIALAARILALPEDRPRRVALDGMPLVGKSTLAAELAAVVEGAGRPVVRVAYDDLRAPRDAGHRQGDQSAEDHLENSHDPAALRRMVLEPPDEVPSAAVVLVEGEFLLVPELADAWDLAVLLVADPAALLERALARDTDLGDPDEVREVYLRRYLAAWALYQDRHDPWARADVVVDLTDPQRPRALSGL